MVRDRKMAETAQINIFFPYLNEDFISFAEKIPLKFKTTDRVAKLIGGSETALRESSEEQLKEIQETHQEFLFLSELC